MFSKSALLTIRFALEANINALAEMLDDMTLTESVRNHVAGELYLNRLAHAEVMHEIRG